MRFRGVRSAPTARAPSFALRERGEDADHAVESASEIDRGDGDLHRPLAFMACGCHEPRERLDGEVVAPFLGAWPRLAEGRDRAVHEVRVDLRERVVVEPVLGQRPWAHVLDEHVGLGEQLAQPGATRFRPEVELE